MIATAVMLMYTYFYHNRFPFWSSSLVEALVIWGIIYDNWKDKKGEKKGDEGDGRIKGANKGGGGGIKGDANL